MLGKKGVVVFDFDGVIGDSVRECFVQSLNAYADLGGRVATSKAVEKAFRSARPLITKTEHFITVLRLIQENPRIDFNKMSQQQFDAEHRKDAGNAGRFAERFYAHREQMRAISPKEWLALQKSFPKIAKFVAKVQKKNQVFIATTKDKKSVTELLRVYGIRIPEKNIVTKEFSKDKKQQLREIARRAGVSIREVLLVEDAVAQLRQASKIGVRGVLASWGYSTKAQRKEAKGEGIPLMRKANIFGRVKIWRAQRRRGK